MNTVKFFIFFFSLSFLASPLNAQTNEELDILFSALENNFRENQVGRTTFSSSVNLSITPLKIAIEKFPDWASGENTTTYFVNSVLAEISETPEVHRANEKAFRQSLKAYSSKKGFSLNVLFEGPYEYVCRISKNDQLIGHLKLKNQKALSYAAIYPSMSTDHLANGISTILDNIDLSLDDLKGGFEEEVDGFKSRKSFLNSRNTYIVETPGEEDFVLMELEMYECHSFIDQISLLKTDKFDLINEIDHNKEDLLALIRRNNLNYSMLFIVNGEKLYVSVHPEGEVESSDGFEELYATLDDLKDAQYNSFYKFTQDYSGKSLGAKGSQLKNELLPKYNLLVANHKPDKGQGVRLNPYRKDVNIGYDQECHVIILSNNCNDIALHPYKKNTHDLSTKAKPLPGEKGLYGAQFIYQVKSSDGIAHFEFYQNCTDQHQDLRIFVYRAGSTPEGREFIEDEKQYKAQNRYDNEWLGLGVKHSLDDNEPASLSRVESAFPAAKMGVSKGDLLLNVDGHVTNGLGKQVVDTWLYQKGSQTTDLLIHMVAKNKLVSFEVTGGKNGSFEIVSEEDAYQDVVNKKLGSHTYTGKTKYGNPHGKGKILYEDGSEYEGELHQSQTNGYGVFTSGKNFRYEGQWKFNKREGQGTLTHNGTTSSGIWKDNKRNGTFTEIEGGIEFLVVYKMDEKISSKNKEDVSATSETGVKPESSNPKKQKVEVKEKAIAQTDIGIRAQRPYTRISNTLSGFAAKKAGIREGDTILSIDGKDKEAASKAGTNFELLMKGAAKSKLVIVVEKSRTKAILEVELERGEGGSYKILSQTDPDIKSGIYFLHGKDSNIAEITLVSQRSPAFYAGVQKGMDLLAVNGVSCSKMTEEEIKGALQGKKGKLIKVRISKNGEEKELSFKL